MAVLLPMLVSLILSILFCFQTLVSDADCYVTLKLSSASSSVGRTKVVTNNKSPEWNETFTFTVNDILQVRLLSNWHNTVTKILYNLQHLYCTNYSKRSLMFCFVWINYNHYTSLIRGHAALLWGPLGNCKCYHFYLLLLLLLLLPLLPPSTTTSGNLPSHENKPIFAHRSSLMDNKGGFVGYMVAPQLPYFFYSLFFIWITISY